MNPPITAYKDTTCHCTTHVTNKTCYSFSPQIYFYFYSLLRAVAASALRARRGLPAVKAGSTEARTEDIGVPASLLVAAVAGAVNMFCTSPAQVGFVSQVFECVLQSL